MSTIDLYSLISPKTILLGIFPFFFALSVPSFYWIVYLTISIFYGIYIYAVIYIIFKIKEYFLISYALAVLLIFLITVKNS